MDPLVLLDRAEAKGAIPKPVAKRVREKMPVLAGAVKRVERASELKYPPYFIEPVLPYSRSGAEYGQMGILYARVIPTTATGALSVLVQFSAALLLYGTKATVEAIAAHEFTHYIDLIRRVSRTDVVSDESVSTLYESSYVDTERTVPPKAVFADKTLVALVSRKFKETLVDPSLNQKVGDRWVAKNLPMREVPPEENRVRISMGMIVRTKFDPGVLAKIASIEEKMKA